VTERERERERERKRERRRRNGGAGGVVAWSKRRYIYYFSEGNKKCYCSDSSQAVAARPSGKGKV